MKFFVECRSRVTYLRGIQETVMAETPKTDRRGKRAKHRTMGSKVEDIPAETLDSEHPARKGSNTGNDTDEDKGRQDAKPGGHQYPDG